LKNLFKKVSPGSTIGQCTTMNPRVRWSQVTPRVSASQASADGSIDTLGTNCIDCTQLNNINVLIECVRGRRGVCVICAANVAITQVRVCLAPCGSINKGHTSTQPPNHWRGHNERANTNGNTNTNFVGRVLVRDPL